MTKYAYIVGACSKYTPELNALINSLDYVGNTYDFHLLGIHLEDSFTSQFDKLGYKIIHHKISEEEIAESHGISEVTCRKRYWYAGEIGKDYDAICVLDADLIFTRNPWQFFDIAAKTGFVLGVHKEQNKVYDREHHKAKGVPLVEPGFWNDKDLCNCPLFIDARKYEVPLKRSWDIFMDGFPDTNFKAPDMDAMNLTFLEAGLYDKIIKLSNHSWLGTNESILKPYTRAILKHGLLFTENGQEIFCFHGQYYKHKWRECQLDNRHRCAEGYLKCNMDSQAKGSMELLTSIFNKMCFEHKVIIEPKNYCHPELDHRE